MIKLDFYPLFIVLLKIKQTFLQKCFAVVIAFDINQMIIKLNQGEANHVLYLNINYENESEFRWN